MSVINTNVKSLVAQNSLTVNNRAMSKTMEQLSTGKRINSAADDAAGLAISDRMTSQIRGLNQAVRNANDGISLLKTAEGALIEVTNMMQRMRELAVQSSNDTNSDEDRNYLQLEYAALSTEITRVKNDTEFNGMTLLNGANPFIFQIGSNNSQTMSVTIAEIAGTPGTGGTAMEATIGAPVSGTSGQTATLDFLAQNTATAFVAGDKISLKVGDVSFNYTVTAADVADFTAGPGNAGDGQGDLLVTKLAALINSNSSMQGKVLASSSNDGTASLTLTGVSTTDPFTLEVTVGGTSGTTVTGDISTQAGAATAITTLTTALEAVGQSRAELGASMNRLVYAADNLANISTNTAASRSRVMDTDYAQATTELARTQIIQQAATAMLAQANQQPAAVLSLLQ